MAMASGTPATTPRTHRCRKASRRKGGDGAQPGDHGAAILYAPLTDAEGPDHLERADWMVRQAEEMVDLAPPHLRWMYEHSLSQAKAHRDVIARFGRPPRRNEVLGRTSTLEELEYLREQVPVHERKPPEVSSAS